MNQLNPIRALIVGIDGYPHMRPLRCAVADAHDFHSLLIGARVASDAVSLLVDGAATRTAILAALDLLRQDVKPDETVILFFSSHGIMVKAGDANADYLCPIDAELGRVRETCVNSAEIGSALRELPSARALALFDACHSGGLGETRRASEQVRFGISARGYERMMRAWPRDHCRLPPRGAIAGEREHAERPLHQLRLGGARRWCRPFRWKRLNERSVRLRLSSRRGHWSAASLLAVSC